MKKVLAMFALSLAGIALVACGSSSNDNSTTATSTSSGTAAGAPAVAAVKAISISADPNGALKFDTTKLSAKAGSDTFDFTNDAPIAHDFTIEDSSGSKVAATPIFSGGTKSVTATLKPGTYTFLCTVPSHADAGMKGTLTVK
ncbi:MAG: plastocyanin/azurin family copper-binding protein [Actinomycetota bacterium]|nr:plastocyanin/azurin family copper-binding protein [Actinomycetota bacterium]